MNLSWDEIKPFLSERGALEVELAAQRALIAAQAARIDELEGDGDG